MNPDLFKVEFKRGIGALLPYARVHKQSTKTRTRIEASGAERSYVFPPYFMIFTIEAFPETDCPMVSVSAPMRPIKILSAAEKDLVQEAFSEIFPDHNIVAMHKTLLPGNSAFKVVALPPGAPAELARVYKAMGAPKR